VTAIEPARALLLLLVAAASIVAWAAAGELAWPARALLAALVGPLPALAVSQARALAEGPPVPRTVIYVSSMISLWLLALVTAIAAAASGFTRRLLGLSVIDARSIACWTLLCLSAAAAMYIAGRLLHVREDPMLEKVLPLTPREKLWFIPLSITAGICEEFVFRGFAVSALTAATGSMWIGALIAAPLFGMLHAYQGSVGITRTAALGFVLSLPMLLTGSLIPGMIAHTLIDIAGGWFGRQWIAR